MKLSNLALPGLLLGLFTGVTALLVRGRTVQADGAPDARPASGPARNEAVTVPRFRTVGVHDDERQPASMEEATLAGRVFEDAEEITVAGARVLIERPSRAEPPLELLTDEGGTFEVGLPPGRYVVRVEPGKPLSPRTMDVELLPGRTARLSIALEASFSRVVLVRDSTPGRVSVLPEPVPHASLRLVPVKSPDGAQGHSEGSSQPFLSTDQDGSVVLQEVPAGDYALFVSASGFADQRRRVTFSYSAFLASPVKPIVVPMIRRGDDLVGMVLDDRGRPIAGALVAFAARVEGSSRTFSRRARERGDQFAPGLPPSCRTDEHGAFRMATLQGFARRAVVVVPESESAPTVFGRVLGERVEQPLVLQAPPSCAVDLRFEHEGSPVRGHVSISDGRWRYDWSADPLLSRIPREVPGEVEPAEGPVRVRLPLGGFQLLFSPNDAATPEKAVFLRIDALAPRSATFSIP